MEQEVGGSSPPNCTSASLQVFLPRLSLSSLPVSSEMSDELVIFARFHAIEGNEGALEAELRATMARTRAEPGCLFIGVYRSVRNARLFFINSRWVDEAAFDVHAARHRRSASSSGRHDWSTTLST